MKVIVGADFVPTKSNVDSFINGDSTTLLGDRIVSVLKQADFRVFNLEVPLVDQETPIIKNGPALIAPVNSINLYKKINVNLFTLANNHIMDQGVEGLRSTINALQQENIEYVGVGENLHQMKRVHFYEYNNEVLGVYACSETEFSIATENKGGANPIDDLHSVEFINKAKEKCDYLIILYHGGKEHYRYPSPLLQKRCRRYCDAGADLVVCQHSHCIGSQEIYNGSCIVYGQGNFLFDNNSNEFWNSGILLDIDTSERNIKYIPIEKNDGCIRVASDKKEKKILSEFFERSECIKSEAFIKEKYLELSNQFLNSYLIGLSSIDVSLIAKVINKLSRGRYYEWKLKKIYQNDKLVKILNTMECETHRELLAYAINQKIS